ncbi:MAG: FHA domain-containing protein [Anaerolineae bacterium]|nr:FHA domain-containing protein [Anaerolineae bacterium]MCI0609771.1 FHA domain-containing protein [Anaerolineae bacterium]
MIATVVLALRFALAIALYAFLGWALFTLLQELKQQGNKLSTQKKPSITIFVNIEKKRESQRYFTQTEIIIGRDTHCDLSVMDETLSAHHARITYHHGQWWLEDLNSRNGTFLNREKLNTPAVIITGDQFKCGNTLFDIRVDTDDAVPENST